MSQELTEQFIYPTNKILKQAYQAVICAVVKKRQVRFFAPALSLEILDYMGWPDDSGLNIVDNNSGTSKPSGPHYRKAQNLLRTFEGKFTKFIGVGMVLEVFIFKPDKTRVSSFAELERLCAVDPYMSEVVATNLNLNLDQSWNDEYAEKPTFAVSQELSIIDAEIAEKQAQIVKLGHPARHNGVVRGRSLKTTAYNIPAYDISMETDFPVETEV